MKKNIVPNNHEKKLGDNDFIVSKTDTTGKITYANRIFMEIAGYPESELLGVQHNIIRHPDMPRGVFRFMWDTLKKGDEFFGFAKNLCADGGFYWVFANITPDYDKNGKLQGYYSVRRKPPQSALDTALPRAPGASRAQGAGQGRCRRRTSTSWTGRRWGRSPARGRSGA